MSLENSRSDPGLVAGSQSAELVRDKKGSDDNIKVLMSKSGQKNLEGTLKVSRQHLNEKQPGKSPTQSSFNEIVSQS